jgi:hypothetical protein
MNCTNSCQRKDLCQIYGFHLNSQQIQIALGTSPEDENFRKIWLQKKQIEERRSKLPEKKKDVGAGKGIKRLLIKQYQCPGDILALTASLYSLHNQYPRQFLTATHTNHPSIFMNNPHHIPQSQYDIEIEAGLDLIHKSCQEPISMIGAFCDNIGKQLGIQLRASTNKPHVHLTAQEKIPPKNLPKRYALINSSYKADCELKHWGFDNYQEVVDKYRDIEWIQIGQSCHKHLPLNGAINLIDKTTVRQLLVLANHCTFSLSHFTFLSHAVAAFNKPSICVMSREPPSWQYYPNQRHLFAHLPCSPCWLSNKKDCRNLVDGTPLCSKLITPEMVLHEIELIMKFFT